jgi:chloramphenicol O-acetyltransferase
MSTARTFHLATFARSGDLNTFSLRANRTYPAFHAHDVSKPVVRSSFRKKCAFHKTKCTSKTPRFRFRAKDDIVRVMDTK